MLATCPECWGEIAYDLEEECIREHGICPDCFEQKYGKEYEGKKD